MAFSGGLIQHLLPWLQRVRRPQRKERARSIVEEASNSSSSDDEGHDALLLEQYGKTFTHCCYDNNVSHTSTTKVTVGTFSPTSSLKSRQSVCCMHRACHLGNGYYMNGKHSSSWDKRTAHRKKIPVCRCLHQIREDGFGEKYENVFYDLSLARKTRRTSSQPSLAPPTKTGLSLDKVDMRCTTSAWCIEAKGPVTTQGAVSIRKTVLPGMAIPMLKIRRPNGRLIFNMEITIRR